MSILLKPPAPKDIFKIIELALNLIGKVYNKISKKGSRIESINYNSTIENIDTILQVFSEFKEAVRVQVKDIEDAVFNEIEYYSEELFQILEDYSEKIENYNVRSRIIKNQIIDLSAKIRGSIDDYIARKLSLSNIECCNLLKMIPGSKKEEALNEYFLRIIREAIENSCIELKMCLDNIFTDVEIEIQDALKVNQIKMQDVQNCMNRLITNRGSLTYRMTITNAYIKINACEYVEELFDLE